MQPYEIVTAIMIGFAVFYLLLEFVLNLNDVDHDTSNVILLQCSKKQMFILPFAFGAIGGHLFLGTTDPAFKMSDSMYPVILLFVIALVSIFIGWKVKFEKPKWLFTVLLAAGVAYGHLFWSMNYITPGV